MALNFNAKFTKNASISAVTSLVIHTRDVKVPISAIFLTMQLSSFKSGEIMACYDALGFRLLGWCSPFWPHWRLLFFPRHDVLSEVNHSDRF